MFCLCVRPRERTLPEALCLGATTSSLAEERNVPVFAASVVHGRAVILGAMQRTGRVVDVHACAQAGVTVLRRQTTGTAAWLDGSGLVLSLALPHVAALHEDATNRTLLNRNVRPFLRAFTRSGAMAHYFGREWISLRKRPVALIGFDVTRTGAVLIEVILGGDRSIALPAEFQTAEERVVDRFMGKTPAGLCEVVPGARLETFLEKFVESIDPDNASMIDLSPPDVSSWMPLVDVMDPWPPGYEPKVLVRVPIGYLEVGVSNAGGSSSWCLGGDVLAPRWLYADVASRIDREKLVSAPIEGATLEDMIQVLAQFRGV